MLILQRKATTQIVVSTTPRYHPETEFTSSQKDPLIQYAPHDWPVHMKLIGENTWHQITHHMKLLSDLIDVFNPVNSFPLDMF